MPPEQRPIDYRVPIKSTWKDALGVPLTNRRITNRIKQGWYGELARLRYLATCSNKEQRNKARTELKRFDGVMVKAAKAGRRVAAPIDIGEFV